MKSPIDEGITAEDLGHVLFMGVGGVGMSGLARLYATRGLSVSGSELHEWPSLAELERLGVTVHREHRASNLDGIDTLVRSTVHPDDHLEIAEARRRGIRVYHRSEALAAAMTGKKSIVVSGTHGKTTTTGMITDMLAAAGLNPSFVNGGESAADGRSGAHGSGELFVTEADESDRSFLRYRPFVSILTNIDVDHLNTYGTIEELVEGFAEFLRGTDPSGSIIVCADDERAAAVGKRLAAEGRTVVSYGTDAEADLRIGEITIDASGARYTASYRGRDLGSFFVTVPGRHLALNSAAALLAGLLLDVDVEELRTGLAAFTGVRRRFELTGTVAGVRVYDEYAYHPTAMNAALSTLKTIAEPGRLIVVFQPYRVYRTRDLRTEIAEALALADLAVVMEVFGPGEELADDDGGRPLVEAIPLPPQAKRFVPQWSDVPGAVREWAREGDTVVTMGAPPISLMPADILRELLPPESTE
ncbi:UDP-N-acetylmuramate--L-alanine ligase [Stackebrandtia nassauensis]|uniref:UDP-N-acetylmuramate--L-alanine ligase n=1 Tax=Stackebrandtia nassauensis (strain DSM 44728 / CIP 108903 / NRRL B-16338 / NBRC 102104 / LLR-40K-21) TaxID=446470 RepID=D3PZX5_STANL|nr:UDP-N-acetylmuramate--L-alanine ligase [Stackebrandtia nassauensis]ADD43662.1 UDP-N-acetylmuramate/alanine ligase [Stackebrandtia nassauensis DSM 44728]